MGSPSLLSPGLDSDTGTFVAAFIPYLLPQVSAGRCSGCLGEDLETCIHFATWIYMHLLIPPGAAAINYPSPVPS